MSRAKGEVMSKSKGKVLSKSKGKVLSKPKGEVVIDSRRCKGCGLCISACPKKNIHLADEADARGIRVAYLEAAHDCTGCGFCYVVCPDVAVTVYRRKGTAK